MSKLAGCLFRTLYRTFRFVTPKILQIWTQLNRPHLNPFCSFGVFLVAWWVQSVTPGSYLLLLQFHKRTAMFISACANAINMVSFLKVRSSKSAHNLVVHIRSYLAPSLFLADSLKKVPNIQQRVHNTTPPSAVSMCMARSNHVAKQGFVTVLARPVVMSALKKKETFIIKRQFLAILWEICRLSLLYVPPAKCYS